MKYVDGFVVPVPKKNLKAYCRMSQAAGKIWRAYGALDYKECAGDNLNVKGMASFPRMAKLKAGETIMFAWIVYKSRAQRNSINKKIMKDPRIENMMKGKKMPFDVKRMIYGGFKVMVDA